MTRRQGRSVRWWSLALLLAATAAGAAAAPAEPDLLLPVHPDDLLILEVHAERYLASRGLIGYHHDEKVLLPLGELAAVLEYAVHADPRLGVSEGWLGDESRTFRLDVAARSVTLAGHQHGLGEACLYVDDEDIYVTSEMLARWWPIELEVDLRGLRVVIRAKEPLPLLTRLQREAAWDQHLKREDDATPYPRRQAGYRLATWPFLDATATYNADRQRQTWRGSLLSRGDLARLSVTGFLNYNQHAGQPWTAWLRAGRSDRDAGLLGPLAATEFEIGDVTSDALALIGGSRRGRGIALTNRPLGSVSQFEAIDIHGDAPPGWDVELYLNGALHDIQSVGGAGRFTFTAVPLRLGLNTIRSVLYGPNGQVRENVRTYNIRSGMWRRGQFLYNHASLQLGESILGSLNGIAADGEHGGWHHQLDLGYGLSPLTTIGLATVRTRVADQDRDYVQARLLQALRGLFLQAVAVSDLDGGHAGNLSAQAMVGDQSLYLSYAQFADFGGATPEVADRLARRLESRLAGNLRPHARNPLNYRLRWRGDRFEDDADLARDYVDLNLNTTVDGFNIGHELGYLGERGADDSDAVVGRWLVAGYLRRTRVRGEVDYGLRGAGGMRSIGLAANHAFRPTLTGQLSARRSFQGDSATYLSGNLDWHLRAVRLGLRMGYNTFGGASVGLAATTSLARPPGGGAWQVSSQRLTQHGAAIAIAFIDHDGDGVYGPGDEPLAGVGFRRHQLWRDVQTDANGRAFLPGIHANQFVNVMIDVTSVDDPFLVPVYAGLTTMVHPGGIVNLAFPFRYVGEIEGYVARDAEATRPLRGIGLELLDAGGRRVGDAVSEFDGYYLIQNVSPGEYHIGVVASTLRGRPLAVPEPQPVAVPPGGDYVRGPTIVLRERAHEVEPVVAASPEVPSDPAPATDHAAPHLAVRGDDPAPIDTVAAVDPSVDEADGPPPQVQRTLHLIYEMLLESKLFARE